MPYDNKNNRSIAAKVMQLNQTHINHENTINDNAEANDPVTSQVESMTLKHPDIVGGNGYAAATLGYMGFEPTLGAEGGAKPKKPRKKKGEGLAGAGGMGAGLAAAGMAAAGMAGAGMAGAREIGGALLTLTDLDKMHGQPPTDVRANIGAPTKPYNAAQVGQATVPANPSNATQRSGRNRNDLVREIMKSQGISLPQASKHIKENKLD